MSPAASGDEFELPSIEELEAWDTAYLSEAAARWRKAATESKGVFAEHRQNVAAPGGTTWEGDAKDSALDRVSADSAVVDRHGEVLEACAKIAEDGHADVQAAKRDLLEVVQATRDDGFTIASNRAVTDSRRYNIMTIQDRNRAAREHAEDIRWYAERLVQADALVGERLAKKATELDEIRFEGEGDGHGTVQLVDNETKNPDAETDPADTDDPDADPETSDADTTEDPKSQHRKYPNRNRDGTYRDENSADGKDGEKAALDRREEETGITLDRRQVRATHPDVKNPETKKPQHRYYDALEPTDNPDEYIGIEAKSHEDVDRTPGQKRFDKAVTPERPATAVVDGREIRIVGTDLAHPPDGWNEAPTGSGESTEPSGAASTGAGADVSGPSLPPALTDAGAGRFAGVHADGSASADTPHFPDWGTRLTPQQMADSDDPAMRVLGQQLLQQARQRSGNVYNPEGVA